jgi:hypothetical protein
MLSYFICSWDKRLKKNNANIVIVVSLYVCYVILCLLYSNGVVVMSSYVTSSLCLLYLVGLKNTVVRKGSPMHNNVPCIIMYHLVCCLVSFPSGKSPPVCCNF